MKNWNVQFLLEIIFHPQIMIPHEEIPLSRSSASLPKTRMKPLGLRFYIRTKKSNKSPNKKESYTFNFVHATNLFSGKLNSGVGAPKC
jgi:hypothetical protein